MNHLRMLIAASVLIVSSWAACATPPLVPQSGWYWNPSESGRGFFIESRDGATFIGAYLYEADGHATWLVAGGPNDDPSSYTGPLYSMSNGQTLFGAYVAPVGPNIAGTISVHFADETHASITWPGGTVAVQRQIFGGENEELTPLSGWWWDPDENGSGYSVEIQGDQLFLVGFMYDADGRPVWYYSAGRMSSETTYHGGVLRYANGQTMSGPYRPPGSPTTVGTLDIEFTAVDEATFTFTELASASAVADSMHRAATPPRKSKKNGRPLIPPKSAFADFYSGKFRLVYKFIGPGLSGQETWSGLVDRLDSAGPGKLKGTTRYILAKGSITVVVDSTRTVGGASCHFAGVNALGVVPSAVQLEIDRYGKYTFTVDTIGLDLQVPGATTCTGGAATNENFPVEQIETVVASVNVTGLSDDLAPLPAPKGSFFHLIGDEGFVYLAPYPPQGSH